MTTTKRANRTRRGTWTREEVQLNPREAVRAYIERAELDEHTGRLLAPFALAGKLGSDLTRQLFAGIDPGTPFRHRAWFWWNCLKLSGLEDFWFADEYNRQRITFRQWMKRIQGGTTYAQRTRLLDLLNKKDLWVRDRPGRNTSLWTKGGNWPSERGMSRILVLGEHLFRPLSRYGRYVTPDDLAGLETELHRINLADKLIYPDAYRNTCVYTISRIRALAQNRSLSWGYITWFFQHDLYREEDNRWVRMDGSRSKQGLQVRNGPPIW